MATYGHTFTSGDTVTPTKLNNARTVSNIVNADVSASAAIAYSKLNLASSVALSDLVSAVANALVPVGAVMPFAMNSVPAGWLAADGSAVSRTTYATLFSVIGTLGGAGDGSTTFNLPDLRGIFVRGSGTQTLGGVVYSKSFGAKETDEFKSHTHEATNRSSTDGALAAVVTVGGTGIGAGTISLANTGGAETRPANMALLYCIKF